MREDGNFSRKEIDSTNTCALSKQQNSFRQERQSRYRTGVFRFVKHRIVRAIDRFSELKLRTIGHDEATFGAIENSQPPAQRGARQVSVVYRQQFSISERPCFTECRKAPARLRWRDV